MEPITSSRSSEGQHGILPKPAFVEIMQILLPTTFHLPTCRTTNLPIISQENDFNDITAYLELPTEYSDISMMIPDRPILLNQTDAESVNSLLQQKVSISLSTALIKLDIIH